MKKIKILFLYPPEQSWPGKQVKPSELLISQEIAITPPKLTR